MCEKKAPLADLMMLMHDFYTANGSFEFTAQAQREFAEQVSQHVHTAQQQIQTLESISGKLSEACKAVAEDVCELLCPSVWITSQGRPPCSAKCQQIRLALSEVNNYKKEYL